MAEEVSADVSENSSSAGVVESGSESAERSPLRPVVVLRCVGGIFRRELRIGAPELDPGQVSILPHTLPGRLVSINGVPVPGTEAELLPLITIRPPFRDAPSLDLVFAKEELPLVPEFLRQDDEEMKQSVCIDLERLDAEAITINEDVMVTHMDAGSVWEEGLHLGDVILAADGIPVTDVAEWNAQVEKIEAAAVVKDAKWVLTVSRSRTRRQRQERSLVPEKLRPIVLLDPDCLYYLRTVEYKPGSLGLKVETLCDKVVVVKVDSQKDGAVNFQPWDAILTINEFPIKEASAARSIMSGGGGRARCLVERPARDSGREKRKAAYRELLEKRAMAARKAADNAPIPMDVVAIASKAQADFTRVKDSKPKSIFHDKGETKARATLSASCPEEASQEVAIPSDYPPNTRFKSVPCPYAKTLSAAKVSTPPKPVAVDSDDLSKDDKSQSD